MQHFYPPVLNQQQQQNQRQQTQNKKEKEKEINDWLKEQGQTYEYKIARIYIWFAHRICIKSN